LAILSLAARAQLPRLPVAGRRHVI